VITCDAEIQSVKRYEEGEEITLFSNKGRGGTCVQPVFNYIEQHNLNVDNMICFTDMGIFDYPDRAPDYPILWVSSYSRGKPAPFGETVYLNTGD
jgi:predicted metal-dependent peptidase